MTKKKKTKKSKPKKHNYAFIDNENVNISVQRQGRKIDRGKLREWLRERFDVQKAYMFMGYIEKYQPMYDFFESLDYELIFKPINTAPHIPNKGNVDAEMVLQAMIDIDNYRQAIIMTGDGDFACLVRHLRSKRKLQRVIVPNKNRYAELLEKATGKQKIYSLTRMKKKLQYIPGDEPVILEKKTEFNQSDRSSPSEAKSSTQQRSDNTSRPKDQKRQHAQTNKQNNKKKEKNTKTTQTNKTKQHTTNKTNTTKKTKRSSPPSKNTSRQQKKHGSSSHSSRKRHTSRSGVNHAKHPRPKPSTKGSEYDDKFYA